MASHVKASTLTMGSFEKKQEDPKFLSAPEQAPSVNTITESSKLWNSNVANTLTASKPHSDVAKNNDPLPKRMTRQDVYATAVVELEKDDMDKHCQALAHEVQKVAQLKLQNWYNGHPKYATLRLKVKVTAVQGGSTLHPKIEESLEYRLESYDGTTVFKSGKVSECETVAFGREDNLVKLMTPQLVEEIVDILGIPRRTGGSGRLGRSLSSKSLAAMAAAAHPQEAAKGKNNSSRDRNGGFVASTGSVEPLPACFVSDPKYNRTTEDRKLTGKVTRNDVRCTVEVALEQPEDADNGHCQHLAEQVQMLAGLKLHKWYGGEAQHAKYLLRIKVVLAHDGSALSAMTMGAVGTPVEQCLEYELVSVADGRVYKSGRVGGSESVAFGRENHLVKNMTPKTVDEIVRRVSIARRTSAAFE